MGKLVLALAILLAGCATPSPYPARYCGLICPDLMPTKQNCVWEQCRDGKVTEALWSAPFIPVLSHPHPEGGRDGRVRV